MAFVYFRTVRSDLSKENGSTPPAC